MTRILYISPGPVSPSRDIANDLFAFLSNIAEGEILLPISKASRNDVAPHLKLTFPVYRVGNFRYHFFLLYRHREPIRRIKRFVFYVQEGLRLHREKKFDIIMAYGSNLPGIAGVALKWWTGARLIVEVPGVPENAFRYDEPGAKFKNAWKRFAANRLLNLIGEAADCIKLLYPWQLTKYPRLADKKTAVFAGFTPVSTISDMVRDECTNDKYVLLAGFPWYTKGADVLIRAFKKIASQFPDYKLKLMGHYPDRTYLDALAKGYPQIEILKALPYEEGLKVIAGCSVYVLASRTESMGRVLLEAMAARKPIIASAVGGVPQYIRDNDNGLLFESENVEELAGKLSLVLSSPELRERLANRAYERAMSEFDERAFVREFKKMLESIADSPSTLARSTEPVQSSSGTTGR